MCSTKRIQQTKNHSKYAGIVACVFAFLLSLSLQPALAQAEVRNSDVVLGQTVEQQGFTASQAPNIACEYAYLVSSDGTIYYARNAYEQVHIASITKIMTAIVALEYGGDPAQTEITVSEAAASIGESSAQLQAGDVISLESAIKALMIPSGNDAGQALAESLGPKILEELKKDPSIPQEEMPQNGYDAFVYAMNKKALALGMNDARFSNPHGLDYDQFSGDMHCSAQNVSTMARAAMQNELFRSVPHRRPRSRSSAVTNGSIFSLNRQICCSIRMKVHAVSRLDIPNWQGSALLAHASVTERCSMRSCSILLQRLNVSLIAKNCGTGSITTP